MNGNWVIQSCCDDSILAIKKWNTAKWISWGVGIRISNLRYLYEKSISWHNWTVQLIHRNYNCIWWGLVTDQRLDKSGITRARNLSCSLKANLLGELNWDQIILVNLKARCKVESVSSISSSVDLIVETDLHFSKLTYLCHSQSKIRRLATLINLISLSVKALDDKWWIGKYISSVINRCHLQPEFIASNQTILAKSWCICCNNNGFHCCLAVQWSWLVWEVQSVARVVQQSVITNWCGRVKCYFDLTSNRYCVRELHAKCVCHVLIICNYTGSCYFTSLDNNTCCSSHRVLVRSLINQLENWIDLHVSRYFKVPKIKLACRVLNPKDLQINWCSPCVSWLVWEHVIK